MHAFGFLPKRVNIKQKDREECASWNRFKLIDHIQTDGWLMHGRDMDRSDRMIETPQIYKCALNLE